MRRFIICTVVIALLGFGGWWIWNSQSNVRDAIEQYVGNGELQTLKARITADQLMEKHRQTLLANDEHSFREPLLKYHPYLLLETKYSYPDKKTREGVLLWSLVDGEIVLDTETWEKTHGFEDAIRVNANASDFKIMNALARNHGTLTRNQLEKELHLEADILTPWITGAKQKQLIVQIGEELQLHLEEPKILVYPQTKMKEALVTKPYNYTQCMVRKYSKDQIEKIAQAAFGSALTIRSTSEVFLPIHCLEVQNPDGSVLTSYWNALTGQRILK